ncbi:MAG: TIGR01212 family radical SAM protein [Bacteroidales bacterium]|nr:TIGR01212 family radical SAM protein [Bacteroidales bacterium]MDD3131770.1 TIGR01212 family radical SAM protein [Bacteroidales bacterium]NLO51919.1 TIGR01212 family radical SAM protein [Bacteroidales bacterium]
MNQEFPWGHSRRYNAYAQYFERTFGARVQKVTIDAGFTCPNRDGTKGRGGCTYCNNDAFNPSYCSPQKSITQQIEEGIEFHANRYRRAEKFLAYFQAYSNTYDSLENLKRKYDQALQIENVAGLVIGTRPDCIDREKLRYFAEVAKTHYVIIEYGLESCYDASLVKINRGHTFQESKNAIELTASYGLKTGAHIIFGLPGETKQMMLDEAAILSGLPLTTLKLHQLQIVKDTRMAKEFVADPGQFIFFGLEEYIDLVIGFLEKLSPKIVIERFAGEVPPRFLASPGWGIIRYDQILQKIEKKLTARNSWQGKRFL